MSINYREAKRILNKQEEAREVINSYRGLESIGKRMQMRNNKDLILKLFEIEEDEAIVEVFTHLKALYEEQWGDAEATAPPDNPGVVTADGTDSADAADLDETIATPQAEAVPAA
ncbi:MAG: hypothetical protein HOB63_05500 [Opitutae bacterium]|jgi:hypothetical protein|nr:hypothetical protein [Opitutae bacterium]